MTLSLLPVFQVKKVEPQHQFEFDGPNPWLDHGGWLLMIFAVLHFYAPTLIPTLAELRDRNRARNSEPIDLVERIGE